MKPPDLVCTLLKPLDGRKHPAEHERADDGGRQTLHAELAELQEQFHKHKLHVKLAELRSLLYRCAAHLVKSKHVSFGP